MRASWRASAHPRRRRGQRRVVAVAEFYRLHGQVRPSRMVTTQIYLPIWSGSEFQTWRQADFRPSDLLAPSSCLIKPVSSTCPGLRQ